MITVIATHNKNKVIELQNALKEILHTDKLYTASEMGISDDDIIEDGKTFEDNALIKARAVWKNGILSIADDSGICVNALGGAPGIHSARFAGEPCDNDKNNEKLLEMLKDKEDRSAYYVSCIACKLPDGSEFTVRGEVHGIILNEYRGNGGFGYDPLFYYPPFDKTFAEVPLEQKNSVSHRGNAVKLLADELKKRL